MGMTDYHTVMQCMGLCLFVGVSIQKSASLHDLVIACTDLFVLHRIGCCSVACPKWVGADHPQKTAKQIFNADCTILPLGCITATYASYVCQLLG